MAPQIDPRFADLFKGLRRRHWRVILIDFPWAWKARTKKGYQRSPERHYPTVEAEAAHTWPIADLAHPDGCVMIMWTTWPLLAQGTPQALCRALGFEPVSGGEWLKLTRKGGAIWQGTGYHFRGSLEPFIIARRGKKMPFNDTKASRSQSNAIVAPVREHSRKPDAMREKIEARYQGPRLEIFGRARAPGWTVKGNEVGKFKD